MTTGNIITIVISVASIVIGFIIQYFTVISKLSKDISKIDKDLSERLASLETKTSLWWQCIESNVVKMLKSYPTNIRKDILLDKLIKRDLSLTQAEELRTILYGEMEIRRNKKLAYTLVLASLEQLIFDLKRCENVKSN